VVAVTNLPSHFAVAADRCAALGMHPLFAAEGNHRQNRRGSAPQARQDSGRHCGAGDVGPPQRHFEIAPPQRQIGGAFIHGGQTMPGQLPVDRMVKLDPTSFRRGRHREKRLRP